MKKPASTILTLFLLSALTACGNTQTSDPATLPGTVTKAPATSTFEATVIEVSDHTILVEPADGSAELNSANRIEVPAQDDTELQVGDLIEITYHGEIMESYPAQLGEIYGVALIQSAAETDQTKNIEESSQADTAREWDKIPMVMVNDKLYYDTGRESTDNERCGNMDGQITSTVDGSQMPTKNNESNFGSGFGYQYGTEDTIEIYMNEKWIIFEYRDGAE